MNLYWNIEIVEGMRNPIWNWIGLGIGKEKIEGVNREEFLKGNWSIGFSKYALFKD